MSASPLLSIVVPTFGRPNALRRCLDAIERHAPADRETICVVVEGDEATLAALQGREVRIERQPTRGGFVQAANIGFRASRGRWLLQLNDDARVRPHAIGNAIRFLEAPAHREVVGQAAFFHDTPTTRNVCQQLECDGRWFRVLHVRGLCYANFGLVRRELAERLGFYDERFRMYGADPDFSLKIWHEAGLEVRPCPGSLVEHDELADERAELERRAQGDDNALLWSKWGM